MSVALIGYTGFVGSNILRQTNIDFCYNSKNIDSIRGKSFDLVICAGGPAIKWWANKNPRNDLITIKNLAEILITINAKRFVLISTVDVYPEQLVVDEHTSIDMRKISPYGKHRLELEKKLIGAFEKCYVIRLPGLFGKGIKKNILFDMVCQNMIEKVNLSSSFQWYPLSRIWGDISKVIEADLPLVNFSTPPILTQIIKDKFFQGLNVGANPLQVVHYDMHSRYGYIFDGMKGNYIISKDEVLFEMEKWLQQPEVVCE